MKSKHIFKFCMILIIVCYFFGSPTNAEEWKKIEDIPNTQGYLGPNGANIKYDSGLYKYYTETRRNMRMDESIIIEVRSYDYQPVVYVRDQTGNIIQWAQKGQAIQNQGRWLYSCRFEFNPPNDGQYTIFHTSEQISQGTYWISGAVFRWMKDQPPPPLPPDPKAWFPAINGKNPRIETPFDRYSKRVRAVYSLNTWIYTAWVEPGQSDLGLIRNARSYCRNPQRVEGNVYYTSGEGIFIISQNKKAYVRMKVHDREFAPMTQQFIEIAKKALAAAEALAVDQ